MISKIYIKNIILIYFQLKKHFQKVFCTIIKFTLKLRLRDLLLISGLYRPRSNPFLISSVSTIYDNMKF